MANSVRPARLARIIEKLCCDHDAQYCGKYGEPGYLDPTGGVILANWNDVDRVTCRVLETAGYEMEWSDEWTIDYNNDKAYRTSPDSYGWRPSAVLAPEWCEYLFPDDGASCAIDAFASDTAATVSAVPFWVTDADLRAAGFKLYGRDYESGFHPGQNDDPSDIARVLLAPNGLARRVVGRVDDSGQFDCRFSVWYEPALIQKITLFGSQFAEQYIAGGVYALVCDAPDGSRVLITNNAGDDLPTAYDYWIGVQDADGNETLACRSTIGE